MPVPQDPLPIAPCHGEVVRGGEVELRWAPVSDAEAYRVQVATDRSFGDLVLDAEVPGSASSLRLHRQPLARAQRLYWRVLARDGDNWSDGERVDAFVATPDAGQAAPADPASDEPLGPTEGLLRSAAPIDDAAGASAQSPENTEIVTLGLTMLIAGALVVVAILLLLFLAL